MTPEDIDDLVTYLMNTTNFNDATFIVELLIKEGLFDDPVMTDVVLRVYISTFPQYPAVLDIFKKHKKALKQMQLYDSIVSLYRGGF